MTRRRIRHPEDWCQTDGQSVTEIGAALGTSPQAVSQRILLLARRMWRETPHGDALTHPRAMRAIAGDA